MNISRLRLLLWPLPLYLFLVLPLLVQAKDKAEEIPALILKVEGDGVATVKKRNGIPEVAGVGGKLFPGDRVITDTRSAVHLLINDGSIIKVGFATNFKIEAAEPHGTFISWTFSLVNGMVRALVEKIPVKETRFRVNTPSGTVGVRGTEFIVAYDEGSHTSFLFTIEGKVSFGAAECEKNSSCLEVGGGEASTFKTGDKKAAPAHKFDVKELFGLSAEKAEGDKPAGAAAAKAASPEALARLSLFLDARKLTQKPFTDLDEAMLTKVEMDGIAEFMSAQDRVIGRLKEQREAMLSDLKKGEMEDTLDAADAYAAAKGVFKADTNGKAENLFAPTANAKHQLGTAVKRAFEAGAYSKSDRKTEKSGKSPWADNKFVPRKNVEFKNQDEAKKQKAELDKALDEYHKMLAYVEALQDARAEAAKTACKGSACKLKRLVEEMDISAEGLVKAFSGTGEKDDNKGNSKELGKGKTGTVSTKFFSRPVAGNGCFMPKEECVMKPCAALTTNRKSCKSGDFVKSCTVKQIPVKCAEKAPSSDF